MLNQKLSIKDTCFQNVIFKLQEYWAKQGCAILQPIDLEVGAGTLHYFTVLKALSQKTWRAAYVQPCRRPTDSRYAQNPNRVGQYYQFQVLIKPAPENLQELYLGSLEYIGLDIKNNDVRFLEDDWKNPSVGASGLGWEVWFNGMEVSQFTYMQIIGGVECKQIPGEVTYGLERLVMHLQDVDSIFDINWNGEEGDKKITYRDVYHSNEVQQSHYILEYSDTDILFRQFADAEQMSQKLIGHKLPFPAYEQALKASHLLNLLDARGVISVTERASYIARVRDLVRICCEVYAEQEG